MTESTALTVVEPEVKPPPEYGEIKTNAFVPLKRKGLENAPDAEVPFWMPAKEGLFLHRRSILGRGIVKPSTWPKFLPELGTTGHFQYTAPDIPAELCSQIVNFFRWAWDEHQAEAEVILLMHYETKEWAIHVPRQKVTGVSVESALDPADIPEKHLIVGTMHSHCNFSAFHSGTDKGDAEDMDGIHLTIGKVDQETPEIVAMIMLNGVEFTFKPENVGDFTQLETLAPEEWAKRVFTHSSEISEEDKEIFEKYGKKRSHTPPTKPWSYQNNYQQTPPYVRPPNTRDWRQEWANDDDYEWWTSYREPRSWDKQQPTPPKQTSSQREYWEDYLDDNLLDSIFASSLTTEQDLEEAFEKQGQAQDINYWRGVFLMKISVAVNILYLMGMTVQYQATLTDSEKGKRKQAPKAPEPKENTDTDDRDIIIDANLGVAYVEDKGLLPNDTHKTLADRLEDEGFKILEVRTDGTVVLDVREQLEDGDEAPVDDTIIEGEFLDLSLEEVLSGKLTKIAKV